MKYESEYYGVQAVPFEPELKHHGIKGQKWGVRRFQNPDGSLTDAGQKRYAKQMVREAGRGRFGIFNESTLPKNKEYDAMQKAKAAYKESNRLEDEYWRNDKERRKYATKAADATYEENGKKYGYTKDEWRYMYTDEDFDQDEIDSFHLYARDKGIDVDAYHKSVDEAYRKFDEASMKYVDSVLGKYGDTKIKDLETGTYENGKFVPYETSLRNWTHRKVMWSKR